MLDQILNRMNALLRRKGLAPLNTEEVRFILDEKVRWGDPVTAVEGDLLLGEEVEEELLSGAVGASWVHANLIRTSGGTPLVTLAFGERVGNPTPTINVSMEREKEVHLVPESRGGERA